MQPHQYALSSLSSTKIALKKESCAPDNSHSQSVKHISFLHKPVNSSFIHLADQHIVSVSGRLVRARTTGERFAGPREVLMELSLFAFGDVREQRFAGATERTAVTFRTDADGQRMRVGDAATVAVEVP